MGQHTATIDIDLVTDGDIIAEDSSVFQPCPSSDCAVPSDNGALDPGVLLDLDIGKNDTSLQTHTIANDDVGADCDIRANLAVLADARRWINEDVPAVNIWLCCGRQ